LLKIQVICTFIWRWASVGPDFLVPCETEWMLLLPLTFVSDFPTFSTVFLSALDALCRISWTKGILKV